MGFHHIRDGIRFCLERLRDRTGRYKRIADMVEIRPVQTAAEERVRSAFDR